MVCCKPELPASCNGRAHRRAARSDGWLAESGDHCNEVKRRGRCGWHADGMPAREPRCAPSWRPSLASGARRGPSLATTASLARAAGPWQPPIDRLRRLNRRCGW
jgi:hypothetical protein